MRRLNSAATVAILVLLLAGFAADADDAVEAIPGRISCTPTTDPDLLEVADLCGDGRVFTLMLPSGSAIPLRAETPAVLQDLDVNVDRSVVLHGWLAERSGVFVVNEVELARVAVRGEPPGSGTRT